jgi:hypothetical protein
MSDDFQREYLIRLSPRLAQLYQRADNHKSARNRHANTSLVFEAMVKLATALAVATCVHDVERGGARLAVFDRRLVHPALPWQGQWVAMLRALSRYFLIIPVLVSARW